MNPATDNVWLWIGIGTLAVVIAFVVILAYAGRHTGQKMINGE